MYIWYLDYAELKAERDQLRAELYALKAGQGEAVAIAECREVHGHMCQFLNRTQHGMDTLRDGDKLYTAPPAATIQGEAVAWVIVVPGTTFKSVGFGVQLQDLPVGTELYAARQEVKS